MKITSTDVDIVKYTLSKRLKGFKLLRNPKGTPKTTVSMVKVETSINEYNDLTQTITRTTKDFSLPCKPEETDNLYTTRYSMDGRTLSNKKFILYVPENKKYAFTARKSDYYQLGERKLPEHNEEFRRASLNILLKEESKSFYKSNAEKFSEYTPPDDGVAKTRPNFFKILWKNLKG